MLTDVVKMSKVQMVVTKPVWLRESVRPSRYRCGWRGPGLPCTEQVSRVESSGGNTPCHCPQTSACRKHASLLLQIMWIKWLIFSVKQCWSQKVRKDKSLSKERLKDYNTRVKLHLILLRPGLLQTGICRKQVWYVIVCSESITECDQSMISIIQWVIHNSGQSQLCSSVRYLFSVLPWQWDVRGRGGSTTTGRQH